MTIEEIIKKLQQYPNKMPVKIRTAKNDIENIYEISEIIEGFHGTVIIDSWAEE